MILLILNNHFDMHGDMHAIFGVIIHFSISPFFRAVLSRFAPKPMDSTNQFAMLFQKPVR